MSNGSVVALTPLQQLEADLRACVGGDGVFRLKKNSIASASINAIFGVFVPEAGEIAVSKASVGIPVGLDFVQVSGAGASTPFEKTSISAEFTIPNEAEMVLTATAVKDWNLGVAFPGLASTDAAQLTFSGGPTLVLSTTPGGGAPTLDFSGSLNVDGPLLKFAIILPSGPLAMTGSIESISAGNPECSLKAPTGQSVSIGRYSLALTVTLDSSARSGFTFLGVGCELRFGDRPDDALVISAEASSEPSIVFVATPVGPPLGVSALARLMDGANAGGVLPTQFPVLDAFGFAGWSMSVNPATGGIVAMTLDVANIQPWPLTQRLTLDTLQFGFALTPGSRPPLALSIDADVAITQKDSPPAVVHLFAQFPAFAFGGQLQPNVPLQLKSLGQFISDDAAEVFPDLAISTLDLTATPPSGSFSFHVVIEGHWGIVGNIDLVRLEFKLTRLASGISGLLAGKVDLTGDQTYLEASAAYNGTTGWLFSGTLTNATLEFGKLAARFFPAFENVDLGTLHITKLSVTFNAGTKAYAFYIDATLLFDLAPGFQLTFGVLIDVRSGKVSLGDPVTTRRFLAPPQPLPDHVLARIVEHSAIAVPDALSGTITGSVSFNNLKLSVTAILPENSSAKPIYKFAFLGVNGTLDAGVLTMTFDQPTLGAMIETLVNGAVPGQNFRLSPPWSVLNSIELQGLSFIIDFNTGKQRAGLKKTFTSLDFGFVAIQEISVYYNIDRRPGQPRVEFAIEKGRFLNETITPAKPKAWDVLDPSTAPQTPGLGSGIFDLRFLAVGQHVAPTTTIDTTSVVTAVDSLKKAFVKSSAAALPGASPISGTKLAYADGINWMLGFDATFLGVLSLRAIFLDPELYGVAISLAGDKAGQLKNLKFEILYKKVNDGLGVYQIELTLPDAFRQIELGQVSITLPVIRVWIYTNGDFKVDFGFPENANFSRSFGLQILPFTGAGGFYFGVMSGQSSTRTPKSNRGNFAPVIELGIGFRVGIGKEINKGILSAGLSVTLQGIIEGAFATFNPYPGEALPDNLFFFWIRGKFLLVGYLYGEINFAIISARLDITITLGVSFEMQIYEPVTFGVFASIEVKLSVKVNLGIFKITVNLSFKTGIDLTFTIGSKQTPPWADTLPSPRQQRLLAAMRMSLSDPDACPSEPPAPNWLKVIPSTAKTLPLYVAPQFTAASDVTEQIAGAAAAQLVTMLYVGTTVGGELVTWSAFDELAGAALTWAIAASLFGGTEVALDTVLDAPVTLEGLQLLYCALVPKGVSQPFTATQVRAFLSNYFAVTITPAPTSGSELQVSFVPMFPWMTLTRPDGTTFSFENDNQITSVELDAIRKIFNELEVKYRDEAANGARAVAIDDDQASMATFMFVDFFAMLARATVQTAIDALRAASVAVDGRSLTAIASAHPEWGISVEELAHANRMRPLRSGVTLRVPPFRRRLRRGERPADVAAAFGVGAMDLDWHAASMRPSAGPVAVTVRNARHVVDGDSPRTFFEIARQYGVTVDDLALANADVGALFATDRLVALAVESMKVSDLLAQLQATAKFEQLSGLAARVFLQGMRPVWKGAPTPLFTISGQQFDASALIEGSELTLSTTESWIRFPNDAGSLTMSIGADEAALIQTFNRAALSPVFSAAIQPYEGVQPKRFTLANAIVWAPLEVPRFLNGRGRVAAATTDPTIWAFPDNLQQLLLGDPALRVKVTVGEDVAADAAPTATGAVPYSWAMTFDATVRRVRSAADPSQLLAYTYDFLGTTPSGSALLHALLATPEADRLPIDQIYVLYPPQGGDAPPPLGLTSYPIAGTTFFLVQTNLSTESNPPSVAVERTRPQTSGVTVDPFGQKPLDFLKCAWEASVVRSGGYQLYYRHAGDTTAGLPDYLFEQSTEVAITIVVTFQNPGDTLFGFLNALIADKPVDTDKTVFFLTADAQNDPRLLDRAVTMPPGNVGFEMTRTVDELPLWSKEAAEAAAVPGLDQLFNLLGYQVAATSAFDESPFGLPLTPTEGAGDAPFDRAAIVRVPVVGGPATWTYKTAIPVYPFAKDGSTARAAAGLLPPAAGDPYRGVGQTARIALNFQDMFGNRIVTSSNTPLVLDAPIVYFDDLIGVDSWPSVVTAYEISSDAQLVLYFAFNNDRYVGGGDDVRSRVVADRQKYALIYYQISRNATIAATTSVAPSMSFDLTATLLAWVGAIYTYLTQLYRAEPPTPVGPIAPSIAVTDSSGQSLFALVTAVTVARTGAIDAAAAARLGGSATQAVTQIRPKARPKLPTTADTDDDPLTLAVFADALERAFPQLKVATSEPGPSGDKNGPGPAVWLVRFAQQAGFRYDLQAPRYFSVPPLARTPISRGGVTLHVYGSDQPIDKQPTVIEAFANVDMDAMARELLAFVDLFLSPDYVVPAWLLVHEAPGAIDSIAQVLDAKRAIATAIGAKLTPVYKADALQVPAQATIDRLTQQLLITLSQAYQIDTVVEVPAAIAAPDRARLWGKPVATGGARVLSDVDAAPTYSLSTAVLDLTPGASSSVLPFTFASRDKTAASLVGLPLEYRVNALEHNLQPPIDGYVPGSWLSFVIPFTQTASPLVRAAMASGGSLDVEVPIPLRAFPTPPTMATQTGQSITITDRHSLAQAKLWDYRFEYQYGGASQDRVHAVASFNVSGRASAKAAVTPDLLDALLQFRTAYADLRRDLDANVLRSGDPAIGRVAIESLAWIAGQVATAWPSWTQPPATGLARAGRAPAGASLTQFDDQIQVSEKAIVVGNTPDVLQITIERTGGTFVGALPLVEIAGWQAEPAPGVVPPPGSALWVFKDPTFGEYLTFTQSRNILARQLRYTAIDVLQSENATAGVSIGRNEAYDGRPGNDPFIYRTPEVQFVSNVTPLLTPDVDIDVASFTPLPPPSAKLETYLVNFFTAFFTTAGGAPAGERLVRLGATFAYELNGFPVRVPIFLSLPLPLSPSSGTIPETAAFIMTWFTQRGLLGRAGELQFELSLFASLNDSNVPILRLESLHLDTAKIWEVSDAH